MTRTILRYSLVLGAICLVSSAGLGGLYFSVKDRIELKETSAAETAQMDVLCREDGTSAETLQTVATVRYKDEGDRQVVAGRAPGENGVDELVGYATIGTAQGYSSEIVVMVGVAVDIDRILAIKVLKQQETPGLGARMVEKPASMTLWEAIGAALGRKHSPEQDSTPKFQKQFSGKTYEDVGPDGGDIVAMTGATVSSKAVMRAVREAFDIIRLAVEQNDGAGTLSDGQ